jgi:putative sigma-54 modulation protein
MNIAITFRQMDATESVKSYATEKFAKLQKFHKQPMKVQVTVSCQKTVHHAEVDIHAGSDHFHAREESEDMYASIDKVLDKLEAQMRHSQGKHKGKERVSDKLLPSVEDD